MLEGLHRHAPSRVAAAVLVLTLSGVARLAISEASAAEHRCCCKAGARHACDCPICKSAAIAARLKASERLPPGERASVRAAIARETRQQAPGRPCLTSPCSSPERCPTLAGGADPFLLPVERIALSAPGRGSPPSRPAQAREAPRAPEPPPPRAA
jgi:hypothetical protein